MSILKPFKSPSIFNQDVLSSMDSEEMGALYRINSPYPHIVIDNLFDGDVLNRVLESWPNADGPDYEEHNDGVYVMNKKGSTYKTNTPENIQRVIDELVRPNFLVKLEKLTGINGLIPDPYHFGGGIHETGLGGKLAVHVDYNKHFKFKLDRRLNLIVYLNKDWKKENGGALELWDQGMIEKVREVVPLFNRTVIFSTTSNSFHGHPMPVSGPINIKRRSIALYYFSNGRPEESGPNAEHSTLWKPI